MENKPIKDFIFERLEAKSLTLDKAATLTGISKHFLEAILKSEWKKLPAAPYLCGYFKKLEQVLDVEAGYLWKKFQEESDFRTSGPADRLPENRFAIKAGNRLWLLPTLVIAASMIYVFVSSGRVAGVPDLAITNPLEATLIVNNPLFVLEGSADPVDKLFINGEEVYVDKNGKFQENYNLQSGLNTFEFMAKKFLGKETKVVRQIIYQEEK